MSLSLGHLLASQRVKSQTSPTLISPMPAGQSNHLDFYSSCPCHLVSCGGGHTALLSGEKIGEGAEDMSMDLINWEIDERVLRTWICLNMYS